MPWHGQQNVNSTSNFLGGLGGQLGLQNAGLLQQQILQAGGAPSGNAAGNTSGPQVHFLDVVSVCSCVCICLLLVSRCTGGCNVMLCERAGQVAIAIAIAMLVRARGTGPCCRVLLKWNVRLHQ